jgi:hypothetical protein
MVFTTIFNNISVISWLSVLLGGGGGGYPGKTTDLPQVTDKLYHIMLYQGKHHLSRIRTYVSGDRHQLHR